jgi:hypothetical protein
MPRAWSARACHGLLLLLGLGCGERSRVPVQTADGRHVTQVPLEAREAVRAEMRTMLGSLHDILKASMVGDTSAMREGATRSGLATAADPALEKLLPEGFLQLGVNTHQQFDELAGALATGVPRDSPCRAAHSHHGKLRVLPCDLPAGAAVMLMRERRREPEHTSPPNPLDAADKRGPVRAPRIESLPEAIRNVGFHQSFAADLPFVKPPDHHRQRRSSNG